MVTPSCIRSIRMSGGYLVAGVLFLCGALAQAQGQGGSSLSPEDAAKAWDLQARAVAADLGLSAEETTKLADAYKAAREGHAAALREKLGDEPGGRRNFAAMTEVNKAERAKFETALKGILKEDQAGKAMASLGTFNRRWDRMTLTLEDLKLDDAKKAEANKLVTEYVASSDKAMKEAMESGDWQSARPKAQAMRTELDASLGKILSAEQLATWKNATSMRGQGGSSGGPASTPAPAPAQ